MPPDVIKVDEILTKMLLNLYSEETKLPATIYLEGSEETPIYSDFYWPEFCKKICKIINVEKGCGKEYSRTCEKSFGLHMCFSGLWCYSQSIEVDGRIVGMLVTGQMRLKDKIEESKKNLKQVISKNHLTNKQSEELLKLWSKVQLIDKNDFDKTFVEHLVAIERYIIIEHQRVDELKTITVQSAHEIILPIQSIVANAENLYNELEKPEYKHIAKDILEQMRKLGHITENILGTRQKNEIQKYKKEFRPTDIFPMIQDTIDLFQNEAKNKDVKILDPIINVHFSIIEMSKPHIKQVLFNLFHNAVKYSYASTQESKRYISIVCSLHKSDNPFINSSNYYCIEITNFGIGIKPNEISNGLIFKSGYRGILARDRSRTGSGVGLSVIKEVIETHNGYIEIQSKRLGEGSKIDPYKTMVKVCIPFKQPKRHKYENTKNIVDRR